MPETILWIYAHTHVRILNVTPKYSYEDMSLRLGPAHVYVEMGKI